MFSIVVRKLNSVGKRGVFKSGLMPISSVVTCMLSPWRSIQVPCLFLTPPPAHGVTTDLMIIRTILSNVDRPISTNFHDDDFMYRTTDERL